MTIGLFELTQNAYFRGILTDLIKPIKKAGAKQLCRCFTPTIDIEPKNQELRFLKTLDLLELLVRIERTTY